MFFRFRNIKYALKINRTLKYMPLPIKDIGDVLRQLGDTQDQKKLQNILTKIERLVLNNQLNN